MLCATTVWGGEQRLYVAPTGSDQNSGTREQPLASLGEAQKRGRTLHAQQPADALTITLAGGNYFLTEPLHLGTEDSGTATAPVVICGEAGATVRLIAGRALQDFTAVTDPAILAKLSPPARKNVQVTDLPAQGITDFGSLTERGHELELHPAALELFVQGTPAALATWPNNGWATVHATRSRGALTRFTYQAPRPLATADLRDAWAHGFWEADWSDAWQPVTAGDSASLTIQRAADITHVRDGARFRVHNVLAELDTPGEYYLDRQAGKLYYWPTTAIQPGDAIVSQGDYAISVYDASHITLRNLTIEAARVAAVEVVRGERVSIEHCTLRNLGNLAVNVYEGHGHKIVGCQVHHTGDGALRVEGGDRQTLTACKHEVIDCHIHDYARTTLAYRSAIHVVGVGIRIAGNHIHHGPDGAIHLQGNDHRIEDNEIDHVCRETADTGAIYLGHDWTERGNIIRDNYLHHLGGFHLRDVIGVYLDDFASGTTVKDNVFLEAGRAVLIGGGRDNAIEGNTFIDCVAAIQADARGTTWAKAEVTGEAAPLYERLKAVPATEAVYTQRYPELATLLTDAPALAKGNSIRGNHFCCQIAIDLHDNVAEYAVIRDNHHGNRQELLSQAKANALVVD